MLELQTTYIISHIDLVNLVNSAAFRIVQVVILAVCETLAVVSSGQRFDMNFL